MKFMTLTYRIQHIVFVFICLPMISSAQLTTTGMKILERPAEYHTGPYRILPKTEETMRAATNLLWSAFSDREGNEVYSNPDLNSSVSARLSFLQPLLVVGETDQFVQVVAYQKDAIDRNTRSLTKEVEYYGWLPKTNALLWMRAMVDEKTKFSRKCYAVNSINSLADISAYADRNELKLFARPGGSELSGSRILLYNFVYVYKEYGDFVLIGKKLFLVESSVQSDILGWVSKDIVQQWSHRMALEPLSGTSGYERLENNAPARIFTTLPEALNYANGAATVNPETLVKFEDKFSEKYKPNQPRLPILNIASSNPLVYYTGAVTPVYNSEKEEIMNLDEQSTINEEYEIVRRDRSNVNIVFVLDGSEYVRRYTRPICLAIRNATNMMQDYTSNVNFEYGAVIYRSEGEISCGNEEVQTKPLTGDEQSLINFLARDVVRDDCAAESDYRSVYKGLNKGLDMFRKSTETGQTNILVLIGARGNDDMSEAMQFELARKMADLNCSMMVFQVMNIETKPTYRAFYDGVDFAIRESEKRISEKHKDIWPESPQLDFTVSATNEQLIQMPFPDKAPVPGSLVYTLPGEPMDPKQLELELRNVILGCIENNARLFAKGDAQTRGMGKRFVMDEAVRNMLFQMNVETDLLKLQSVDNLQFFWEGYTPMTRVGCREPFYQYVILVESGELLNLIGELEKLIGDDGLTMNQQKEHIEASFKELASTYLGRAETVSRVKNMRIGEVLDRLHGCPGFERGKVFETTIQDLSELESSDIQTIIDHFNARLELLKEFMELNSFLNFEETYYWIPSSKLP